MPAALHEDDLAEHHGDEIAKRATPAEIRKRAVITMRCNDCGGMPVLYVTWIKNRAVLWCRPEHASEQWQARFLFGTHFGYSSGHCRRLEWVPDRQALADALPSPGSAGRVNLRVSHSEHPRAMQ